MLNLENGRIPKEIKRNIQRECELSKKREEKGLNTPETIEWFDLCEKISDYLDN